MEIRNRWTGAVIYPSDCATVRDLVVAAMKAKADLRWADLRWADLSKADLRGADLSGADLSKADLSKADLRGADMSGVELRWADLSKADLRGADMSGVDLRWADLRWADLREADLRGADLSGADLRGADMSGAKNAALVIARTRILPAGDLIGWKKCRDEKIVKLRIPEAAKRSSALSRKCRAEFAIVLEIIDGHESAVSQHDAAFIYRVGKTVKPTKPFSDDWQSESGSGIYFFITREEAEAH